MTSKRTLAICDRCGLEYRLVKLKYQVVAKKTTTLLVCRSCLDEDQPQWFAARNVRGDPAPVPNARPDVDEDVIYSGMGWGPVGGTGLNIICGIPYDFDMQDTVSILVADHDFIATEEGYRVLQENGNVVILENSI